MPDEDAARSRLDPGARLNVEGAIHREQRILQQRSDVPENDDAWLEMIDAGVRRGYAGVPADVAARLSAWRKDKAEQEQTQEIIRSAPWQHGPVEVSVTAPISVEVPDGYQYLSADDTRRLREKLGQPSSVQSQSLLASEDGHFIMRIVTAQTGHYEEAELKGDLASALDGLENYYRDPLAAGPDAFSAAQLSPPRWLEKPLYDARNHTLSWAYSDPDPAGTGLRSVILRVGRTWSAELQVSTDRDLAMLRPAGLPEEFGVSPADLLKQGRAAAGWLKFASGEDYGDVRATDPRATISISDVITAGRDGAKTRRAMKDALALQDERRARDKWNTVLAGVAKALPLLLIGLGGFGVAKRRKRRDAPPKGDESVR